MRGVENFWVLFAGISRGFCDGCLWQVLRYLKPSFCFVLSSQFLNVQAEPSVYPSCEVNPLNGSD